MPFDYRAQATCDTCRWWDQRKLDSETMGRCKAVPPRLLENREGRHCPMWPVTPRDEYCKHHEEGE